MENSIYGNIYANVLYGKSRRFRDERIGFNVDFDYKDLKAMSDFYNFIKQDHFSNGKGLYSVAIGENVNNLGERGVIGMSFKSGSVLNKYLQNFVLWHNVNVTLGDVNAISLHGRYDDKTEQAVLSKLVEMRMTYVKGHTRPDGTEM
ncbi:MAG: hypothetical protein MJ060_02105 [Clostridia bacterium]|nr:hypothetical protein [Clostridia bacterium]